MSIEQDECAICLCPLANDIGILDCKHRFCYSCIKKWASTENSCCLCKTKFSSISLEKNTKECVACNTRSGRNKKVKEKVNVEDRSQADTNGPEFTLNLLPFLLAHMGPMFGIESSTSMSMEVHVLNEGTGRVDVLHSRHGGGLLSSTSTSGRGFEMNSNSTSATTGSSGGSSFMHSGVEAMSAGRHHPSPDIFRSPSSAVEIGTASRGNFTSTFTNPSIGSSSSSSNSTSFNGRSYNINIQKKRKCENTKLSQTNFQG